MGTSGVGSTAPKLHIEEPIKPVKTNSGKNVGSISVETELKKGAGSTIPDPEVTSPTKWSTEQVS